MNWEYPSLNGGSILNAATVPLKNVFKEYDGPLQLILDSGEQWISFYIYQAKVGTGRNRLHFVNKRHLFTLKGWGGAFCRIILTLSLRVFLL